MKALVLDGDTRAALSIVRSLGRRGMHVTVGSESATSLAGCSRWCSAAVSYPCPRTYPLWFLNWLVFTLNSLPQTMLYTCSDVTTSIAGRSRMSLPSSTRTLMPPQASLEVALDKSKTLAIARKLGIPAPLSVEMRTARSVGAAHLPFRFPVAVKACQSDLPHRTVTRYAAGKTALRASVEEALRECPSVLVQEVVSGEGTAVFALMSSGEPVVTFAHRRIHEKPPWGGVSTLSQSIEPPPDMLENSLKLLRSLKWHGVAMVEFKRNGAGKPMLMEINPRFWGSLELAVRCGVDFPYLAYQLMKGERPEAPRARDGANRWLLGELDSLVIALKATLRGKWSAGEPLKRLWDMRYGMCCEVERISDMRPAIYEYSSWLKSSLCRVTPGLRRGEG